MFGIYERKFSLQNTFFFQFFANTFERSSNARSRANVKTERKKDCFAVKTKLDIQQMLVTLLKLQGSKMFAEGTFLLLKQSFKFLSPQPLVILSRFLAAAGSFHLFVEWKTVLQVMKILTLRKGKKGH